MRSQVYLNDPDALEAAERRLPERAPDPVSEVVGSEVYVRRHRFSELFFETTMGRSPRLPVSRYYWDAVPPTVVDFVSEIRGARREVVAKREYLRAAGIRYLICRDEGDVDSLEEQLASAGGSPEAEGAVSSPPRPPKVAPRRSRRKPS